MDGERQTIFFGMPSYSKIDIHVAIAFLCQASRKHNVQCEFASVSLLGHCFNLLWANALERRDKQGCRYFAMMHNDIVPAEAGYLDVLLDELIANNADVVSAVVPIKTPHGVTSTAVGDPDDPFEQTRLTVKELQHLPRTFNANDMGQQGRPLLLNTGLWICDLNAPWVKSFKGFTIDDEVYYCKNAKKWKSKVVPEDWNWSRHLHQCGARVYATTKVPLTHIGEQRYPNFGGWGQWSYDVESDYHLNLIPTAKPEATHAGQS